MPHQDKLCPSPSQDSHGRGQGSGPGMRLHTRHLQSAPTTVFHLFLPSLLSPTQPPSIPWGRDLQPRLLDLDLCCLSSHAGGRGTTRGYAHPSGAAPPITHPPRAVKGPPISHPPNLQAVLVVTAVPVGSEGRVPSSLLLNAFPEHTPSPEGGGRAGAGQGQGRGRAGAGQLKLLEGYREDHSRS